MRFLIIMSALIYLAFNICTRVNVAYEHLDNKGTIEPVLIQLIK